MASLVCLFLFVLVSSASAACDRCLHESKAAYHSDSAWLSSGACGYGFMALGFNKGFLAAGAPSLYKDGAGCGACFKVRCKDMTLCSRVGTTVFLFDLNQTSNHTDVVLSSNSFAAMAVRGKGPHLLKHGTVDVEYKRVPCEYRNKNLAVRVDESSQKPSNLSLTFINQGGQTEIVLVDVAEENTSDWRYMTKNHGATWSTSSAPVGPLQLRLQVTAGFDGKWWWAKKVLPANWKIGVVYDTGIQITDVAQEGCGSCAEKWPSS